LKTQLKWLGSLLILVLSTAPFTSAQSCGNPCAFGTVWVAPATRTFVGYNSNYWGYYLSTSSSSGPFGASWPYQIGQYAYYNVPITLTASSAGTYSGSVTATYNSSYGPTYPKLTVTINVSATYNPTAGSIYPKYQVLSVIYAPPGPASNVNYSGNTTIGTSSNWANSFQSDTILSVAFSATVPMLGGTNGTVSQTWTETKENSGSITVNKNSSTGILARGPIDPNAGIDHDADLIAVWLNPQADFQATSSTTANWKYSFDQRDPANEMDLQYIQVALLKHPENMSAGLKQVLQRTWAGSGQGLTTEDFTAILASDPFANGNNTVDSKRFDLQAGETFSYLPPACGYQPITETYTLTENTTTAYGQTATDSYQVAYTKTAGGGFPGWLQVNFTATNKLTWTNKWGFGNSSGSGKTAGFSLTGPADCNYSGPVSVQVYQDNVYGTFMFKFLQ
jgi:hypothetical protein